MHIPVGRAQVCKCVPLSGWLNYLRIFFATKIEAYFRAGGTLCVQASVRYSNAFLKYLPAASLFAACGCVVWKICLATAELLVRAHKSNENRRFCRTKIVLHEATEVLVVVHSSHACVMWLELRESEICLEQFHK